MILQVAQAENEYETQLKEERRRIQQAANENLTLKDRKLRLLKSIMNQSDVESLAGDLASQTPSSTTQQYQVSSLTSLYTQKWFFVHI